jgi:hypothetical protein
MKNLPTIVAIVALAVSATPRASADPARFWISASNVAPVALDAPTIDVAENRERKLYIWAQPPHLNGAFQKMHSLSLNLVNARVDPPDENHPAVVDFLNGVGKIQIYNPTVNGVTRYEHVFDSIPSPPYNESLQSNRGFDDVFNNTAYDGIGLVDPPGGSDMQGVSLDPSDFAGIGPVCNTSQGDMCASASNGRAAWLIGEVAFKAVKLGDEDFHLQIGYNGIAVLDGQTTVAPMVAFGSPQGANFEYDSALTSRRQMTLPSDTYDVRIHSVPFTPGDFDSDGSIDAEDYTNWRSSLGQSLPAGEGADANGNGEIDAADYVFWRNAMSGPAAYSSGAASAPIVVPEPGTAVALLFLSTGLCRRMARNRLPSR